MLTEKERKATPQERERARMAFYGMLMRELSRHDDETSETPVNPSTDDGPTRERLAMAGEEVEDFIPDDGRMTVRMMDGSAVHMLYRRGVIDADQYNAGEQFYADWYYAGLAASGVIDPAKERVDGGTHKPQSDEQLASLTRFVRAVRRVGAIHSTVLIRVVLFEDRLEVFGLKRFGKRDRKDARLAAITALQGALSELANHYYGPRRNKGGASHMDDYRPTIPDPDP